MTPYDDFYIGQLHNERLHIMTSEDNQPMSDSIQWHQWTTNQCDTLYGDIRVQPTNERLRTMTSMDNQPMSDSVQLTTKEPSTNEWTPCIYIYGISSECRTFPWRWRNSWKIDFCCTWRTWLVKKKCFKEWVKLFVNPYSWNTKSRTLQNVYEVHVMNILSFPKIM